MINEYGCMATASMEVRVKKNRDIYIPNVISANNDGVNDAFTIFSDDSVERITTLMIFDRWGETVFIVEDIQPNDPTLGWDGTLNNVPMNPGVYVYYAQVLFKDQFVQPFKGDVLLLR